MLPHAPRPYQGMLLRALQSRTHPPVSTMRFRSACVAVVLAGCAYIVAGSGAGATVQVDAAGEVPAASPRSDAFIIAVEYQPPDVMGKIFAFTGGASPAAAVPWRSLPAKRWIPAQLRVDSPRPSPHPRILRSHTYAHTARMHARMHAHGRAHSRLECSFRCYSKLRPPQSVGRPLPSLRLPTHVMQD